MKEIKKKKAEKKAKVNELSKSELAKKEFFDKGNKLPICVNDGCNNDVIVREWKYWSFKSECSRCTQARKNNKKIDGVKIHKKNYCENLNGQLGFKCPVTASTIQESIKAWKEYRASLDLDHADGDHLNNNPDNVKTYCKLCHNRKSKNTGVWNSNKPSRRDIN